MHIIFCVLDSKHALRIVTHVEHEVRGFNPSETARRYKTFTDLAKKMSQGTCFVCIQSVQWETTGCWPAFVLIHSFLHSKIFMSLPSVFVDHKETMNLRGEERKKEVSF